MFVELHLLQNFAPSCLNRDDTNSPKDCEFGGYRRSRISSQCIKRAIRKQFRESGRLQPDELACRTKRLVDESIVPRLVEKGHDVEAAGSAAGVVLEQLKFKLKDKNRTEYLLFLGTNEIQRIVNLIDENFDALAKAGDKNAKAKLPKELAGQIDSLLQQGKAADLALFGRMLANRPEDNVDAAAQVAHAFSTNRIAAMEIDFFTAVDDLQESDEEEGAGAGMMGTVEFNSACFYRYASVHLPELLANLQGDEDLARRSLEAFIRASIEAVPTGKQNTFAAHNPPDLIVAVVRERGQWSLANAFVRPVQPRSEQDLVAGSVAALDRYWGKLAAGFGTDGIVATPYWSLQDDPLGSLNGSRVDKVEALVTQIMDAASFNTEGARP
jgi:CRISPR system Cascade subunit CasC